MKQSLLYINMIGNKIKVSFRGKVMKIISGNSKNEDINISCKCCNANFSLKSKDDFYIKNWIYKPINRYGVCDYKIKIPEYNIKCPVCGYETYVGIDPIDCGEDFNIGMIRGVYANEFLVEFDYVGMEVNCDDQEEKMIRASRKANLTRGELIETFKSKGLVGVYNLGQRYMLEYLENGWGRMTSLCGGSKCSKRGRCRKWAENCHEEGDFQYLDWSTMGYGSAGVNADEGWYCGDLSDGYPMYEEMNKNELPLRFEVFVIQAKDENEECKHYKYHAGYGVMVGDIKDALFHLVEKEAKEELSKFDEPEEFEIRKLHVVLW